MPTRKYIQFYIFNDGDNQINFGNGFSSVWNIVKPEWVELTDNTCKAEKIGNILIRPSILYQDLIIPTLPKADEIWISLVFLAQLPILRAWVFGNPDVKFVVGGPAIVSTLFDTTRYHEVPNLEFKYGTMEDVLGIEQDSNNWNMEIPEHLVGEGRGLVYAISNGVGCWWNKCKFCHSYKMPHSYRPLDPSLTYRVPDGEIWLGSDSLRLADIASMDKIQYDGDRTYTAFVCGTSQEVREFEKLFQKIGNNAKKFKVRIGLEIPSNRMRRILGKPGTIESISSMVNLFDRYGARVSLHIMYAFPNLIDEDIADIKWFVDSIQGCNNVTGFGVRPLELIGSDLFPGVDTRDRFYYLCSKYAKTRMVNLSSYDIDKNTEYLRLMADFVNNHLGTRLVFRKENGPSDQIIENLIR